jgi:hypothetical protein
MTTTYLTHYGTVNFFAAKKFKIEILTENLEHYNTDEKQIYCAVIK